MHLNGFLEPGEPDTPKIPLRLAFCESCKLVQTQHEVSVDTHFRRYYYKSGISDSMRVALADVVAGAQARIDLRHGDVVVDIGSNDSTLLESWSPDLIRIGFEPATNLMEEARKPEMTIVNNYWSLEGLREVTGRKPLVITAIACFYSVPDPNQFVADLRSAIADRGIICIQLMDLNSMMVNADIGNLTPEHVCHYSLTALKALFDRAGLGIFDVEFNDVNGGSMRVWASPAERPKNFRVLQQLTVERDGAAKPHSWAAFAARVDEIKGRVREYVSNNSDVWLYAASTKANLLVDYWGLSREEIRGAADRDPRKRGLEMAGGRIPIRSEEDARRLAKHFLVGAYAFRNEFIRRESEWMGRGGKMIFPMPKWEVVGA